MKWVDVNDAFVTAREPGLNDHDFITAPKPFLVMINMMDLISSHILWHFNKLW